ncbi:MAG TPA: hypothetical protein VGI82_03965 [Chitinophagaceae bacterium]
MRGICHHANTYTRITYKHKPLTVKHSFVLLIIAFAFNKANAQSTLDSIVTRINPQKWSAAVEKKANKIEERIIAKSEKTLRRLERQEEKIYQRELATKDSAQAQQKLAGIQNKYKSLEAKLKDPAASVPGNLKQYIHIPIHSIAMNTSEVFTFYTYC